MALDRSHRWHATVNQSRDDASSGFREDDALDPRAIPHGAPAVDLEYGWRGASRDLRHADGAAVVHPLMTRPRRDAVGNDGAAGGEEASPPADGAGRGAACARPRPRRPRGDDASGGGRKGGSVRAGPAAGEEVAAAAASTRGRDAVGRESDRWRPRPTAYSRCCSRPKRRRMRRSSCRCSRRQDGRSPWPCSRR